MAQLDSEVDMPRFIQEEFNPKKKEDKPVIKPKPGKYTSKELSEAKRIPTKDGYK